ncbi:MAG TPA: toll/interleukin-1 receptor domain-containing protein, partial [Bryobacteraceae bacterium]
MSVEAEKAQVWRAIPVFCSYAHTDEGLLGELAKHLIALERAGLITEWSDRQIPPGAEWPEEIKTAMERAGIILLLLSADFIASK